MTPKTGDTYRPQCIHAQSQCVHSRVHVVISLFHQLNPAMESMFTQQLIEELLQCCANNILA